MKSMKRARRRFDDRRIKRRAASIYPTDQSASWSNHLQGCSCHHCGNPRRHFGEKPISERKADIKLRQEIDLVSEDRMMRYTA